MIELGSLTSAQEELALALVEIMKGHTVGDAFTAMISVIAATCNGGTDGRRDAVSFANRLLATVEAGQRGELRKHGEVLQ